MKKGFTLIELLFVMALIAILAGFSIFNFKNATDSSIKVSLKNDISKAIDKEQKLFLFENSYLSVDSSSNAAVNGFVTVSNHKFPLSKGNTLLITTKNCAHSKGFEVKTSNQNLEGFFSFDSCSNNTIQENFGE